MHKIQLQQLQQPKSTLLSKIKYPQWPIEPMGGIILSIGVLSDNLKPGGDVGLDIGYRINREVGMYAKLGYYFMNSKITGAPVGLSLEFTLGPRYFFTKANLKSSLFVYYKILNEITKKYNS